MFFTSFPPWFVRKLIKSGTTLQKVILRKEKVFHVSNETITVAHYDSTAIVTLPIRVYRPEGEGPFPILVFYHGGGWVICSLDTHDHICRHLCNKINCVVVSVDYRLAPEFKFPTGVEDAYATAVYIHEHASKFQGDPDRIGLAGDSAGGNLSIVISQLARQRNGPRFACTALIYPVSDLRKGHYPSFDGKSIGLSKEDSAWFEGHYFASEADRLDPRASPIVTEDLSDQPPTVVVVGEHDRLRDMGEAYGRRLQEAGVPVEIKMYANVGHGFLSIGAPEVAVQALDFMSEWLNRYFRGKSVPIEQPPPTSIAPDNAQVTQETQETQEIQETEETQETQEIQEAQETLAQTISPS